MIWGNLKHLVHIFFLHIEINTLNLPYWRLPRPHRANPLSRVFRDLFEKANIHRFLGINLAASLALAPLGGQFLEMASPEPPLNLVITQADSPVETHPVTTQAREFVIPVKNHNQISQRFNPGHPGYDITGALGEDVLAFTSGRVHQLESGPFGLGKYIVLDHGHGLMSVYGHLANFDVRIGDHVETGEKIGEIGMTGFTTGPHVHFEIHDNGRAVNPWIYLQK